VELNYFLKQLPNLDGDRLDALKLGRTPDTANPKMILAIMNSLPVGISQNFHHPGLYYVPPSPSQLEAPPQLLAFIIDRINSVVFQVGESNLNHELVRRMLKGFKRIAGNIDFQSVFAKQETLLKAVIKATLDMRDLNGKDILMVMLRSIIAFGCLTCC
jgi:hypothetical protein